MSRVAVLGAEIAIEGYGLAGALIVVAESPDAVRAAWSRIPPDTGLVVLTPAAAEALAGEPTTGEPLTVVMPA